ncbi:MAG TPA: ribosome biogenesis GTP-binding protein YihA/YsxC [Hyphomicrobiaceae bacterium]|nr:ribosome biogenesis GTP-binding protein YihA/YsxC [Hyphomicrobiaceae bacterium]
MPPDDQGHTETSEADRLFGRPWGFVKSAPSLDVLPPLGAAIEIAFAGRSNVGKSSLINALVRRDGLARTSNTPGRTQELNFFETPGVSLFLVDMPGYGFAKAPKDRVEAWTRLVKAYLRGRPALVRVFLLIDARHGIKPPDLEMMRLMDEAAVSYQVVLTKADKISAQELGARIAETQAQLEAHAAAHPDVLATSSAKKTGIAELGEAIAVLVSEVR